MSGGRRQGAGRGPAVVGLLLVAAIAILMAVSIGVTLVEGGFDHTVRP